MELQLICGNRARLGRDGSEFIEFIDEILMGGIGNLGILVLERTVPFI